MAFLDWVQEAIGSKVEDDTWFMSSLVQTCG